MSDTLRTLNQAIAEKRCVAIRYGGRHQVWIIEPHVIYTNSGDNIVIDCYQLSKIAATAEKKGYWRTLLWRDLDSVYLLNSEFHVRLKEGFDPAKSEYKNGLVAMVEVGTARPGATQSLLGRIGASIDRMLSENIPPPKKY
ncbi:MAG: hypothetical protein V3R65_09900 [Acidiferrobacterales bacterium]